MPQTIKKDENNHHEVMITVILIALSYGPFLLLSYLESTFKWIFHPM